MSQFITVPINENGVIFGPDMKDVVAEAIALRILAFQDVYINSHEWSTDAYRALDEYNRFFVDLSKIEAGTARRGRSAFAARKSSAQRAGYRDPLAVGNHGGPEQSAQRPSALYVLYDGASRPKRATQKPVNFWSSAPRGVRGRSTWIDSGSR
jgi:hypothetical protein